MESTTVTLLTHRAKGLFVTGSDREINQDVKAQWPFCTNFSWPALTSHRDSLLQAALNHLQHSIIISYSKKVHRQHHHFTQTPSVSFQDRINKPAGTPDSTAEHLST